MFGVRGLGLCREDLVEARVTSWRILEDVGEPFCKSGVLIAETAL